MPSSSSSSRNATPFAVPGPLAGDDEAADPDRLLVAQALEVAAGDRAALR